MECHNKIKTANSFLELKFCFLGKYVKNDMMSS
jgi:hypothetical protein